MDNKNCIKAIFRDVYKVTNTFLLEQLVNSSQEIKISKKSTLLRVNCTPFVRQVWYNTCIRKWGVFLCQKEDRINDTQGSSSRWLWRP